MEQNKWDDMLEAFQKALDEDLVNPNGYWNTLKKIEEQRESRFDRFEEWMKTNDFDALLQRLFERNGDKRRDWCYNQGWQPYPTPMLQFVYDYITHRVGSEQIYPTGLKETPFDSGLWHFKGYWFKMICGQGECPMQIYDENLEFIFSM